MILPPNQPVERMPGRASLSQLQTNAIGALPGIAHLFRSAQCIIVMKILSIAILFGAACMVAPVTKADSLEFARKSLGLEIGTDLFGAPLSKFEGAEKAGPAQRPNGGAVNWSRVDWYQTKYSAVFGRAHPGRVLRYGFKDGRLVAVHVTVSGLEVSGLGPDKERAARIRESISTMFANFKRLGGQGLVYQDKSLRVLFTPFCNPTENFFAVILLALPEKD